MRIKHLLYSGGALIKAKVFKLKVPLAISWALTFRCNQRCLYCRVCENEVLELNTSEVFAMIDEFAKLGTKWISFTGGEPLLRDDLGEIVKYAIDKGIYVGVNSNGSLVPEKINSLKGVSRIKLSLDGPQSINDYIRGRGSYDKVIEAIEKCKMNNIPVCIECVITKHNLNSLDYILVLAAKLNIKVLFQPTTKRLLWSKDINFLAASSEDYKTSIKYLIGEKKRGAPIYNSLEGLKHIYHWPEPRRIFCSAGLLSFDVEPDGTILACDRAGRGLSRKKDENINVKSVIDQIEPIMNCRQCWCSSLVEFNLITSFNIKAIVNYIKVSKNT